MNLVKKSQNCWMKLNSQLSKPLFFHVNSFFTLLSIFRMILIQMKLFHVQLYNENLNMFICVLFYFIQFHYWHPKNFLTSINTLYFTIWRKKNTRFDNLSRPPQVKSIKNHFLSFCYVQKQLLQQAKNLKMFLHI